MIISQRDFYEVLNVLFILVIVDSCRRQIVVVLIDETVEHASHNILFGYIVGTVP
jgi:hypothetical protein